MRNDRDWVGDLFASVVREWTPGPARHAARVLYAPVSRDPAASRACASVLSEAERERATRFVTEEGTAHFCQRRAFRRYCAAVALGGSPPLLGIVFAETDKGRPHLPGLPECWFSFSSCRRGLLGAWSRTHAIGADIEDRTRSLEAAELARSYFSRAEAEAVATAEGPARPETFFRLWSLKEAALKSIGEGLPFGLDAFRFELAPELRLVDVPSGYGGPGRFDAHLIEAADCCGALVVRERRHGFE